jgi:hypothetical protein
VTASDPPLKRVFDILNWFSKVLPQLAGMRPCLFSHGDVGEGGEVVAVAIAVNLQKQKVLDYTRTSNEVH